MKCCRSAINSYLYPIATLEIQGRCFGDDLQAKDSQLGLPRIIQCYKRIPQQALSSLSWAVWVTGIITSMMIMKYRSLSWWYAIGHISFINFDFHHYFPSFSRHWDSYHHCQFCPSYPNSIILHHLWYMKHPTPSYYEVYSWRQWGRAPKTSDWLK